MRILIVRRLIELVFNKSINTKIKYRNLLLVFRHKLPPFYFARNVFFKKYFIVFPALRFWAVFWTSIGESFIVHNSAQGERDGIKSKRGKPESKDANPQ